MKLDDAIKEAATAAVKLPEGQQLAFKVTDPKALDLPLEPVAPETPLPPGPSKEFLSRRKV